MLHESEASLSSPSVGFTKKSSFQVAGRRTGSYMQRLKLDHITLSIGASVQSTGSQPRLTMSGNKKRRSVNVRPELSKPAKCAFEVHDVTIFPSHFVQ